MNTSFNPLAKSVRRLLFNLRAKSRHGTHSPFIYEFLDKALYTRVDASTPEMRLKQAAKSYFESLGYTFLSWEGSPKELKNWLSDNAANREMLVLFWKGIRSNPEHQLFWQEISKHPNIRQILETYGAVLLFFRTNQVREHFKIRL